MKRQRRVGMAKKENAEPRTTSGGFSAGRRENTTKAPHISSASMGSISHPSKKVNRRKSTETAKGDRQNVFSALACF